MNKLLQRVVFPTLLPLVMVVMLPAQEVKPDVLLLAKAMNQFAADLHQQLATKSSPTAGPGSIAMALLMLVPGARGATADELCTVLHLPAELRGARLEAAAAQLLRDCAGSGTNDDNASLRIVNAIWVQKDYSFVAAYLDTLRRSFAAGHHVVDFARDPEDVRRLINTDVAKSTNDRIKELIPDGFLTPETRCVLTNAMWFKGAWQTPFVPANTQNAPFTLADGRRVDVPMMHMIEECGYAANEAWRAITLPFRGSTITCEIVVPRDQHTLAEAERALLSGTAHRAFASTQVELGLPRFRIAAEHRLASTLQTMGLATAFSSQADFHGIDAKNPLWIDEVVHQAWIQLDEYGVEAAAATAVVLKTSAAAKQEVLTVDRAFAFALRDARTGLLLFVGRVEDPSATPQ